MEALFARDQAPIAATEDMFLNQDKVKGPLAIAVPGEVKGMWEMHQRYGHLPWATLIKPTIELCRSGHNVTRFMGAMLKEYRNTILNTPSMEVFVNPETRDVYREGDKLKRLKLADTLEILARDGADSLYNNGTLGRLLVKDIQEHGGIISERDLMEYSVRWEEPVHATIQNGLKAYSLPAPASGPLVVFMLNILDGFIPNDLKTMYIRIAETFKHAYARRSGLADPRFVDVADVSETTSILLVFE